MRGNVFAAFAAAVVIMLFAYFRLSHDVSDDLVDPLALPGSWTRAATESCNPALPARLAIADDLSYVADAGAGVMVVDELGRYTMRTEGAAFQERVFRAEAERLEVLNRLGCKATYVRAD